MLLLKVVFAALQVHLFLVKVAQVGFKPVTMQRKLNIQGNKEMCWHPGCLVHELRIVQLNWGC